MTKPWFLLACSALQREFESLLSTAARPVCTRFVTMGLHDRSADAAREVLQAEVDAVDEDAFDAILLGYGLCNRGAIGLCARSLPLIIPKVQDCVGMLLGGRERYVELASAQPRNWYRLPGWMEAEASGPNPLRNGLSPDLAEIEASHGAEAARWLEEQLGAHRACYDTDVFLDDGSEHAAGWAEAAERSAAEADRAFRREPAKLDVLRAMLAGTWDPDRFAVAPPGATFRDRHDGELLDAAGEAS